LAFRIARRLEWTTPEGSKILGEYWLQTPDPNVVVVSEADHISQILAMTQGWDDVFDISIYPAVSAQEGMELVKQMS
jgi:hypothetical protein